MSDTKSEMLFAVLRYEEAPYQSLLPDFPARWVVEAAAPVKVFQAGLTREEAIEKTKAFLKSVNFKGILKLVESDAD